MADVDVDRPRVAERRVAPDAREEHVAGEDAAGVAGQRLEDLELHEGQLDVGAAHANRALGGVDLEVDDLQGRLLLERLGARHPRAAQGGPHARPELAQRERLGDVVVGAELEAEDLVDLLGLRREHDDRDGRARAQPPAHLEPVHLAHHHVEHDEVQGRLGEALQRLPAVVGAYDLVAVLLEREAEQRLDRLLVVDEEDAWRAIGHVQHTVPLRMLNLRLYRTAWLPVLFCAVIVAFSLHERPRGVPTTLAPDAFDGPRAARTLEGLATAFPDRRPGSPGDDRLAERVRAGFVHAFCAGVDRAECSDRVRERRFSARTIDGHRELRTVVAQRPGRLEGRIVVLAHRDAAGRGAKADLSATAGLLELAQVLAGRVTERTVTLVSTSGGSGGSAGAADFAAHAGGPVDAVIVLGDLAGTVSHSPWVVPWSNARGSASMRLQRTAELAVREEAGSPGSPGVATQFLRLAYPLTVSEQGPLDAAGIPAVLIGPGGELGATPDEAVDANRLRIFGRGVLRTITALDNGADVERAAATGLVVHGQVVPEWAMRLPVGTLLLPA